MKLVFNKNEQLEVTVSQKSGDETTEFNYVDMIKSLVTNKKLDEPEVVGEFLESEKDSISSMINHINEEVTKFYAEEEE